MSNLQKVVLGTPPKGDDGDTVRVANVKANANVDILNAQAALTSYGGVITTAGGLWAALVGKRVNIALAAAGVITLLAANTVAADSVILLRNVGATVITLGVAAGSGDTVALSKLNPGESVLLDTDGVHAWTVLMRGRTNNDNETVNGNCTVGGSVLATGKLNGVNSPNLLPNGSGELGNAGWASSVFSSTPGGVGEGTVFLNGAAITTGSLVRDASNPITIGAGVVVTVSAQVGTGGMTRGRAYVNVEAFNSSGASLGLFTGTSPLAFGQPLTYDAVSGTTPTGTSYVVVYKATDSNPLSAASGVTFKRIKLELGNTASLYSQEASIAQLQGALAPVGQCRLTASGGNLLLARKDGAYLTIAGAAQLIPPAGVALAPTGLVAGVVYYVYAYMSAGVMTLVADTKGHVTDANSGVEVKNGNSAYTLVGMVYLATSGTFAACARATYFNRTGTYGTVTNSGQAQVDTPWAATGGLTWGDESLTLLASGFGSTPIQGNTSVVYLTVDGNPVGQIYQYSNNTAGYAFPVALSAVVYPAEGYHSYSIRGRNDGQMLTMSVQMSVTTRG